MTTPCRPKPLCPAQTAPDPNVLSPRLGARLASERAAQARFQQQLLRIFHRWQEHLHRRTRLQRRLARLEAD